MKTLKGFALATLLLFSLAMAAQTTVTLQVTDADSQSWNIGAYNVYTAASLLTPQPVATATGALNATGGATISLAAGTYTFIVSPAASSTSGGSTGSSQVLNYASSQAISGGTQTVTLAPPAIRIPVMTGVSVKAYSDTEVTGAVVGSRYYSVGALADRIYNGTSWGFVGGAIGSVLQKAETAAPDLNVLTVTPVPVTGMYRVCMAASVSNATSGVIGFTLTWKDSNGNVRAAIAQSLFQEGTAAPALTYTVSAAGAYSACSVIETDNSATNIVLKWVGGGTTAATVSATATKII